jgi:hypothetical protein
MSRGTLVQEIFYSGLFLLGFDFQSSTELCFGYSVWPIRTIADLQPITWPDLTTMVFALCKSLTDYI